jgi:hypothetical protein
VQFPSITLTEIIVKSLPQDDCRSGAVASTVTPKWPSLLQAQEGLQTCWERLLGGIAADCYDHEQGHWVIASPTRFDQYVSRTLVTSLGYFEEAKPHWGKPFIQELSALLQAGPHEWLWGTLRLDDGYIILEPGDCADAPFSSWER